MLDRAAAAWATGESLFVASERNGYRGDFTAGMHISGPDSTTLELLRRSGCRIVAGRGMRDIGEYRRGALSPAQATRALQLVNDVRARGTHCGDVLAEPRS
jgi:hypothetical protein